MMSRGRKIRRKKLLNNRKVIPLFLFVCTGDTRVTLHKISHRKHRIRLNPVEIRHTFPQVPQPPIPTSGPIRKNSDDLLLRNRRDLHYGAIRIPRKRREFLAKCGTRQKESRKEHESAKQHREILHRQRKTPLIGMSCQRGGGEKDAYLGSLDARGV